MFKKLLTNSKGFGHIELFMSLCMIALVFGAGYFVYTNKNSNVIAHAGGWTTVSTLPWQNVTTYTVIACKTPVKDKKLGVDAWNVRTVIESSNPIIKKYPYLWLATAYALPNSSAYTSTSDNLGASKQSSNWQAGNSLHLSFVTAKKNNGYLQIWAFNNDGGEPILTSNSYPNSNYPINNLTNC